MISVERDEHLVGELVAQILPQHFNVLRLHRQQIVAGPLALVHFGHAFKERLAGRLHGCYLSNTNANKHGKAISDKKVERHYYIPVEMYDD